VLGSKYRKLQTIPTNTGNIFLGILTLVLLFIAQTEKIFLAKRSAKKALQSPIDKKFSENFMFL
jgi:hypothetical protein